MPTGPILTLTTDFGVTDLYAAAMKAVLLHSISDLFFSGGPQGRVV